FITSDLAARDRFNRDAQPAIFAARERIKTGFPSTRKNSSGYALDHYLETGDLVDLIIGSEGTLGIIARAEVQLEPLPGATTTALFALGDVHALPAVVEALREMGAATLELLDRSFLALAAPRLPFAMDGVELVLLVDFERDDGPAARDAVERARTRLSKICVRVETAISDEDRERLWATRHAASPALARLPASRRSLQMVEDGCVPVETLARYVIGVREAAREAGLEIVAFGHAGDGHLHINALVDTGQADLEARLSRLLERVTTLLVELKGTASGEHGDGRLRAPVLERIYGTDLMRLFRTVKQAFDPAGILNPGVILPGDGARPTNHLKFGPHAAEIPREVEEALRRIEQSGGWEVAKTDLVRLSRHGNHPPA
ncbi:MAG: hypothetical protein HY560_04685, partial [Gemmatimonadetes bacterium]|nr:hypothetical protein [Gemmatimonadota bacterium]